MLILDMEQSNEAPALDRLVRGWWAKLWAWLRRQPPLEARADEDKSKPDRPGSLIL
jgi:hypothetical protein